MSSFLGLLIWDASGLDLAMAHWRWMAGAMAAGLIFGLAQQIRGAHYMDHTI